MPIPCDFRTVFIKRLDCAGCARGRDLYGCSQFTQCVPMPLSPSAVQQFGEIQACSNCEKRTVNGQLVGIPTSPIPSERPARTPAERRMGPSGELAAVQPQVVEEFDWGTNHLNRGEVETNPSILMIGQDRYAAWQHDSDAIYFGRCNAKWEHDGEGKLVMLPRLPENMKGVMEPRLFDYLGRPWLTYIGLGREGTTQVFTCEVLDGGGVTNHFPVRMPGSGPQERHWTFFGGDDCCQGNIQAIFSWAPTVVFNMDPLGNCSYAHVSTMPMAPAYQIDGGTCPVFKDDRYIAFVRYTAPGPRKQTGVGLVSLQPATPFSAITASPLPLYVDASGQSVVPFGTAFDGGKWWVSLGVAGKSARIIAFEEAVINSALGITP